MRPLSPTSGSSADICNTNVPIPESRAKLVLYIANGIRGVLSFSSSRVTVNRQ